MSRPSRRLRVKLITVPWELEVPTLSLACLAAVTPEDRFEVCIVDALRERVVVDEPVDLVGITASTPCIESAYALADAFRARGVKVVMGGHHVTAMPDEGLQHADAVVIGEGEGSWMRICEQMLTNPAHVEGIYRDPAPSLADLPPPRIDLMKLSRYQPFHYPVIATRGCPASCSFCFAKRMTYGYRAHPIRYVLEQVRRRPRWVRGMYFVDDNLGGDMDYTRELFRELARFKVPFGMQVRNEFSLDPEALRLAREAGCGLISTGFESVSQATLDGTGKRANATVYAEVVANIQREGLIASGNWMFGFDSDTPDIFPATWDFLQSSGIIHSSFTTEIPFPGTPIYKRYLREGRILTTRYSDYRGKDKVVVRPRNMSPRELREGIRWLARRFYSIRHRRRIARTWMRDPRLLPAFRGWSRPLILGFLNYYEVFLWQSRMVPGLRKAYEWALPYYKYRYPRDLLRRTNFWSEPHEPAEAEPPRTVITSPFLDRPSQMPPGGRRLEVVAAADPGAQA